MGVRIRVELEYGLKLAQHCFMTTVSKFDLYAEA